MHTHIHQCAEYDFDDMHSDILQETKSFSRHGSIYEIYNVVYVDRLASLRRLSVPDLITDSGRRDGVNRTGTMSVKWRVH